MTRPTGIQIHAIAIGSDADEKVLRRIAAAAHGRYWKGKDEKDMVRVLALGIRDRNEA